MYVKSQLCWLTDVKASTSVCLVTLAFVFVNFTLVVEGWQSISRYISCLRLGTQTKHSSVDMIINISEYEVSFPISPRTMHVISWKKTPWWKHKSSVYINEWMNEWMNEYAGWMNMLNEWICWMNEYAGWMNMLHEWICCMNEYAGWMNMLDEWIY